MSITSGSLYHGRAATSHHGEEGRVWVGWEGNQTDWTASQTAGSVYELFDVYEVPSTT